MEIETINKLYLEISQITTAVTAKEIDMQKTIDRLLVIAIKHCPKEHHDWREVMSLAKYR